jgi:hypothetical protein
MKCEREKVKLQFTKQAIWQSWFAVTVLRELN